MQNSMNTQGTDGGSVTVALPEIDLAYENDRRALHHARNRIDAGSADGHTYSNILELRKNWELCRPGDFSEQHLPRLMLVQERRLMPRNKAMGE